MFETSFPCPMGWYAAPHQNGDIKNASARLGRLGGILEEKSIESAPGSGSDARQTGENARVFKVVRNFQHQAVLEVLTALQPPSNKQQKPSGKTQQHQNENTHLIRNGPFNPTCNSRHGACQGQKRRRPRRESDCRKCLR